jgi:hypothetical protein
MGTRRSEGGEKGLGEMSSGLRRPAAGTKRTVAADWLAWRADGEPGRATRQASICSLCREYMVIITKCTK